MATPESTCPLSSAQVPGSYRIRPSTHCTHKLLTRIYDQYGVQKCTVCKKVPDFGYLYCCTQDTNGNLPISAFIDEDISMDLADLNVDGQTNQSHAPGSTTSGFTVSDPNDTNLSKNTTIPTDNDMEDDVATDEMLARAFDGKRKHEVAFPPDPNMYEYAGRCKIRICHACRPVYKDRAWQSLDSVIDNNNPALPSQFELDNRRVSKVSTIIHMQTNGEKQDEMPGDEVFDGFSDAKDQVFPESSSEEDLAAIYHAKMSATNSSPSVGDASMSEDISPSAALHVTNATPEKQYEHASDADDEKGFAKDDEDESADSSTDAQGHGETLSDAGEDSRPLLGIYGTTLHLVSNDDAALREGLSESSSGYQRDESMPERDKGEGKEKEKGTQKARMSEEGLDVAIEKKVTPGRFLID